MAVEHAGEARDADRDQRIQSAKKKVSRGGKAIASSASFPHTDLVITSPPLRPTLAQLKSYRAKQALMAKRASGSRQLTPAQAKRISITESSTVANAVQDTILRATEQAQQAMRTSYDGSNSNSTVDAASASNTASKRHSRSYSRAGHGRGHSRAGSISITADKMASAASNALRNSFIGLDQSPQPPAHPSVQSEATSHVAHTRQHSRSASRRFSHISTAGGLTPSSSNPTLLAVEHGPDSFGPPGKASDWADVPSSSSSSDPKAPSPVASPSTTPRASAKPLPRLSTADSLFTSSNDSAPTNASRRLSRHSRKTSLATKRESMELMGGLGFPAISVSQDGGLSGVASPAAARRASRRISGNSRLSGMQSASVLFGGPDRRSALNQDFDWRGSLGLDPTADGDEAAGADVEDRRTALEKLEGRSSSDRPVSISSKRHSRSHSRQSSVQLPSFDEIHGQEGMDRRESVQLLECNERTTLEESKAAGTTILSSSSSSSPWLGLPSSASLGNLNTVLANGASGLSHSQSSPDLIVNSRSPKPRPVSLFAAPEAPQPEGLGTLMEEEEEEDVTSPIKEKDAPRFGSRFEAQEQVEDEEARRRRREEERETIKRTRRSSLQPKPLKLKSRPASLFVSPAMQKKASLLLQSPNAGSSASQSPAFAATSEEDDEDASAPQEAHDHAATTDSAPAGDLTRNWSMSAAQAKVKPHASADDEPVSRVATAPTMTTPTRPKVWRQSIPLTLNTRLNANDAGECEDTNLGETSVTSPSSATKPGMRALRLGSMSGSQSSIAENASSPTPSTLAQRRASYISASQSGGSISDRSDAPLPSPASKTLRRSSIIYKPSGDASSSASPSSNGTSSSTPTAAVPSSIMTAFEDLKAKSSRDAATMEEQRRQIEKLTIDLSSESQRASREYAQLEQWSAEERKQLSASVDEMRDVAKRAQDALAERDASLEAATQKQRETEERIEDLEAERDMLQDDVDGWRTRCGDLEKSLRADKASLEEERQRSYSLALRVQTLMQSLKEAGIDVPTTPTADDVASRQLGLPTDLFSALRSPAINPYAPSASTPSGYFSPRASPADAALPPPQAVKLLKDMRQQIFNLAGSLEHQRKEHLKAQQEAETLRSEKEELQAALELASTGGGAVKTDGNADDDDDAFQFDQPSGSIPISTSFERRNVGKQRHVFAYDSSMGSADQSNTSMCSTSHTNLTSLSDQEDSNNKLDNNEGEALMPLPTLQPLVEEEDVENNNGDDDEKVEEEHDRDGSSRLHEHERSMSSFDLEAGGESWEEDEEAGELYADASHLLEDASTPVVSQDHLAGLQLQKTPVVSLDGHVLSLSSQSGSSPNGSQSARSSGTTCSLDTPGPASLGDDSELRGQLQERDEGHEGRDYLGRQQDVVDVDDDGDDDYIGPYSRERKDRPEFIREWSFQEALQSVRHYSGSSDGVKTTQRRRRAAPRAPSVDDFFGLLLCEQLEPLPPLPTTHSSLEMPPVYVESLFDGPAPAYGEATADLVGKRDVYHPTRASSASVSLRQASVAPGSYKGRPPVARSAYVRDSIGDKQLVQTNVPRSASFGAAAAAAAAVGGGSRALSRVSLQGLTSAFSGLGGYLSGSSGAAVHAAAAASTMCNSDDPTSHSRDPSALASMAAAAPAASWQQQQQRVQSMAGLSGAKRFSTTSNGGNAPLVMDGRRTSTASSTTTTGAKASYVRRFISKDDVVQPTASPVWSLDFLPCTEAVGGPSAFSV